VAAQATIVAPELAPVTGPIAFGAALGEFYYSDDRWGTLGKFVGSYLFGKAYKNIGREAGMPAGNQIRMESLGGMQGGDIVEKILLD